MSRPSFRARPIDVNQSLAIIRDKLDDDQAITREVNHAHKNLDKDNEEVRELDAREGERERGGKGWKRGKKKEGQPSSNRGETKHVITVDF